MKEQIHGAGSVFEPNVDRAYLRSYQNYVPVIAKLFSPLPTKHDGIMITPDALKTSPFALHFYGSWDQKQSLRVGTIYMNFIFADRRPVTSGIAGVVLYIYKQDKEIRGRIDNDTSRIPGSTLVRNLSGIIAPVGDAVCQVAADHLQVPLTARVATSYTTQSRFVQNYLQREYRTITKTDPNAVVTILERQFAPL